MAIELKHRLEGSEDRSRRDTWEATADPGKSKCRAQDREVAEYGNEWSVWPF